MGNDVAADVSEDYEEYRENRTHLVLLQKTEAHDVVGSRQQDGAGRQVGKEVVNAKRNLVQAGRSFEGQVYLLTPILREARYQRITRL